MRWPRNKRTEKRAVAESKAKTEAQEQRARVEEMLNRMQIERAEELFNTDYSAEALAHLTHVLRRNSNHLVAATRLMSALTQRSFALPLTQPLKHKSEVSAARFSPDGLWVVTVSANSARVWDARTGQSLTEPLTHDDLVNSARFSPDGQRIVTASRDQTARVWAVETGRPLTEPLRHNGAVSYSQFSPDGLRVVTASVDGTARVWDARTGQPLAKPMAHNGRVLYAQFSPDGQTHCDHFGKNRMRVGRGDGAAVDQTF